jgi:aspartate kinase
MKFGSSCIKSPTSFDLIAKHLLKQKNNYENIIVVVSAMGDLTDQLISLAHQVHPSPPRREYDMMVSVGERISIALLAMALAKLGEEAISFTGSQSGIITSEEHSDAHIVDIKPIRIFEAFKKYRFIIVAGFQGVSLSKEITTLGRGGSDTTAVALAIGIGANKVQFYKDVPGIANKDPNQYEDALYFPELNYEQALKIVQEGKKAVIHPRAVLLAQKNHIPLEVTSIAASHSKTLIRDKCNTQLSRVVYERELPTHSNCC